MPRYCAAANNWAGRFAAALIASSSVKPTRLSAWSSPVIIFTRQRQALTTVIFSDEATVQLESHRKRGGTNGTERSKTESFLTHTVCMRQITRRGVIYVKGLLACSVWLQERRSYIRLELKCMRGSLCSA